MSRFSSDELKIVEEDGFVERIAYPVVPPHVEYKLTPLGKEIQEQVEGLTVWLEANLHRIMAQRQQRAELTANTL